MIEPRQAMALILEHTFALSSEAVPLVDSIEHILAEDLYARNDLPPFDNSAMDGYAVQSGLSAELDKRNPAVLTIREVVRAGQRHNFSIQRGEAIKIMTGAPIPLGADAVVMKELAEIEGENKVKILKAARPGEHIRKKGEDVRAGALILKKGTRIRPYEVALLSAQGISQVKVVRKPKAAVLVTGDELVEGSSPLQYGKIRDANGPSIVSALKRWGIESIDLGIVGDQPDALLEKFQAALCQADLILVSGGVSAGDFDYTRSLFKKLGVKEIFWKVAIKPGKPLVFGIARQGSGSGDSVKPVFGLPGNPVAALVCLEEFVRPAIEKMSGYSPQHPSYHLIGTALNEYFKPQDRQQYLFCQAKEKNGHFEVEVICPQGSAMMGMACRANALAVSPLGENRIMPGDPILFRWLK